MNLVVPLIGAAAMLIGGLLGSSLVQKVPRRGAFCWSLLFLLLCYFLFVQQCISNADSALFAEKWWWSKPFGGLLLVLGIIEVVGQQFPSFPKYRLKIEGTAMAFGYGLWLPLSAFSG